MNALFKFKHTAGMMVGCAGELPLTEFNLIHQHGNSVCKPQQANFEEML